MHGVIIMLLVGVVSSVQADIYLSQASNGTITLTNLPRNGQRYQQVFSEPTRASVPHPVSSSHLVDHQPFAEQIKQAAEDYDLPTALLHAVIRHESNYDPAALSPKGAAGLMQLMPDTARELGVENVWDPEANIQGGARYLKGLMTRFDQDMSLALAAYNAGPGAVIKNGLMIPPYAETQRYVPRVLDEYHRLLRHSAP